MERHFLSFSGSRERSQSSLMPSPGRAISEETALSCTPTEKKQPFSALSKTSEFSSVAMRSLSYFLSLCVSLTHTHTVACREHGLGSGEVDCSCPRGVLRMKSGVMAVSTIRLMSMVYDPSGRPCTHPNTHIHTHQDGEILLHSLSTSNTFPETSQMCSHMPVY